MQQNPSVEMHNPKLPGQHIWVFPDAVAQHMTSGWAPVEPAKPSRKSSPAPPLSGPSPAPQGTDQDSPSAPEE